MRERNGELVGGGGEGEVVAPAQRLLRVVLLQGNHPEEQNNSIRVLTYLLLYPERSFIYVSVSC